ncbi:hypothetical protein K402DRAFT_339511 [Aulographum hederae CBS 113979]|uniref:FAD binding domain-containing protein n=1 Tax=Aulographum hederae CBS 113979 TaxID=1176131 RepID=A0A6G1GPH7_9PEZI|nr:hypothetical protein K402DRAFT_339511 [Aulographum hederae CBS 113979]
MEKEDDIYDVLVVGAGPAGLMLASNLARLGIHVKIIDSRKDKTSTGRADGLQPKTIETLKQMRLCDGLLEKGVKVWDICFWESTTSESLHRTGRQIHYPPSLVDVADPFILLVHQGMVEDVFISDLAERGVRVQRDTTFTSYNLTPMQVGRVQPIHSSYVTGAGEKKLIKSRYLVGCDGARSAVRQSMPNSKEAARAENEALWGVLDGELDTDFPDLWSKVVVHGEGKGSVLLIPRERNMTRLYIEMTGEGQAGTKPHELKQEDVMDIARSIISPYRLEWKTVEWFGKYSIAQRVSPSFSHDNRVFIAGDASHTHTPKAAQGMNTSMHDTHNLAWKLNLVLRGLAKPNLLNTYVSERKKIADDLIAFDKGHADAFAKGDGEVLQKNFEENVNFISGAGVWYNENILSIFGGHFITQQLSSAYTGLARPGHLLPPASATRYIDANPVSLSTAIPPLGQFIIHILVSNPTASSSALDSLCQSLSRPSSVLQPCTSKATRSYAHQSRPRVPHDDFEQPQRYLQASEIYTSSFVTTAAKPSFEIADLPPLLRKSPWTVYLDDLKQTDGFGTTAPDRLDGVTRKWFGRDLAEKELAVVIVRPDGWVGDVGLWDGERRGEEAGRWVNGYFGAFLDRGEHLVRARL